MTDWEKTAEGAADKTDKELAAGLDKLMAVNTAALFPVPADKAKVDDLIKKIKTATAYNERIAIFKAAGLTLGEGLLKAVKKVMLTLLLGLIAAGWVAAQVSTIPAEPPLSTTTTSLFDFGNFFKALRGGYSFNQHLEKSTVFYTAVQSFHDLAGLEMVTLNAGYDGASKRPVFLIGDRLDNQIPKIWGGKWGKAHVTTASLPTIEFGPYVSGWPIKTGHGYKIDVNYGVVLAIGFPK